MATDAETKEQLKRVNKVLKVAAEEKEELEKRLGIKPTHDVTAKHREEDANKSLFERMSSSELMELYQTDRAKWQEIVDGVLSAGERKIAELQQHSRPW